MDLALAGLAADVEDAAAATEAIWETLQAVTEGGQSDSNAGSSAASSARIVTGSSGSSGSRNFAAAADADAPRGGHGGSHGGGSGAGSIDADALDATEQLHAMLLAVPQGGRGGSSGGSVALDSDALGDDGDVVVCAGSNQGSGGSGGHDGRRPPLTLGMYVPGADASGHGGHGERSLSREGSAAATGSAAGSSLPPSPFLHRRTPRAGSATGAPGSPLPHGNGLAAASPFAARRLSGSAASERDARLAAEAATDALHAALLPATPGRHRRRSSLSSRASEARLAYEAAEATEELYASLVPASALAPRRSSSRASDYRPMSAEPSAENRALRPHPQARHRRHSSLGSRASEARIAAEATDALYATLVPAPQRQDSGSSGLRSAGGSGRSSGRRPRSRRRGEHDWQRSEQSFRCETLAVIECNAIRTLAIKWAAVRNMHGYQPVPRCNRLPRSMRCSAAAHLVAARDM